jgi:hypothetical protein
MRASLNLLDVWRSQLIDSGSVGVQANTARTGELWSKPLFSAQMAAWVRLSAPILRNTVFRSCS